MSTTAPETKCPVDPDDSPPVVETHGRIPPKAQVVLGGVIVALCLALYIGGSLATRRAFIRRYDHGVALYEAGNVYAAREIFADMVGWGISTRDADHMLKVCDDRIGFDNAVDLLAEDRPYDALRIAATIEPSPEVTALINDCAFAIALSPADPGLQGTAD